MVAEGSAAKLYLEDIGVDDMFRSAEHRFDAAQIIVFASQFDPQSFHLDEEAAQGTFSEVWPPVGGTRWQSR